MKHLPSLLDLKKIKVLPLARRRSLSDVNKILVDPAKPPQPLSPGLGMILDDCSRKISAARERGASVILFYGAHLVKNGAHRIVNALVENGWITHLATNGAGTIHDWELAFLGRTEESVRDNVATGTFGTWDETGRNIHIALMVGATRGEGFGQSLGRFIEEDGTTLPEPATLEAELRNAPAHPLSPARAELLRAMTANHLPAGRINVEHPHKKHSLLANAFRCGVPFTVHPGIGYDIIANHPMFRGAVIGRAADIDFRLLGGSIEKLDGGVVLSVGSAIMAPQVFEKSISCVNNLRLQAGRNIVQDHTIYVVDIQDGGGWDWTKGEPPKNNPAYYLRFCKSYARMGGTMNYAQCDNVTFLHNLLCSLNQSGSRG
ncbi:MAG TPA: hypothetical protein PKA41_09135 [Verrucomicrobiota bacterium]|nr:hypothetical protein [Verrucomicrobiota bacterium]